MTTGKLRPKLDAKRETLVRCTKLGMSRRRASFRAGITYTTFKEWMAKDLPFAAQIKNAEAEYEEVALQCIQDAAKDEQWQAGAWLLERRHPERWGKREFVHSKVEKVKAAPLSPAERRAEIDALMSELAAAREELEE